MKIAIVVSTFPPYPGGMGNAAAHHAAMLEAAGHQVTVFAPGVNARPVFTYGNAAWMPQLFWKLIGFDAVELHYPFFGGAEAVWLWKLIFGWKKRLVVVYHMDTVGSGWLGRAFKAYRAILMKPILNAADRIVTASLDYFASSQAAMFAKDARVREIPFAVDTVLFHPAVERQATRDLVFVGGLDRAHYFKGVDVLLEAMKNVPQATLAIVGDGDLRAEYERKAKESGLGNRVAFLGRVSDAEKTAAYRNALIHVLPSIDRSEAFGIVTLEAAASGIPSIVSDLPGVRSVIVQDVTGLAVPPGDPKALAIAIYAMLSDKARTDEMGKAARRRMMERHDQDKVGELLHKAFTD